MLTLMSAEYCELNEIKASSLLRRIQMNTGLSRTEAGIDNIETLCQKSDRIISSAKNYRGK